MRHCIVHLQSQSPYQQGYVVTEPKLPRETADAYEQRTWRYRAHYNAEGKVFIPPISLKKALENAARMTSEQIPGKGKATYTKHFVAGVACVSAPVFDTTMDTVEGHWVFVSSGGQTGRRVWKCFPTWEKWDGEAEFYIYDDIITQDVFERHLRVAGLLVGLGVWRAGSGGLHGKFAPTEFVWADVTL